MELTFLVPSSLRRPGFAKLEVWDTKNGLPLRFRMRVPVLFVNNSPFREPVDMFVDEPADRVVGAYSDYQAPRGGSIQIWSLSTGSLVEAIPIEAGQRVLALSPDGQFVWLASGVGGRVSRLNLSTKVRDQEVVLPIANDAGAVLPLPLAGSFEANNPDALLLASPRTYQTFLIYQGKLAPSIFQGLPILPIRINDQGRYLFGDGKSCVFDQQNVFSDCRPQFSGSATHFLVDVWRNRGLRSDGAFVDLTTGAVLQQAPIQSRVFPLPGIPRIMTNYGHAQWALYEADSLQFLTAVDVGIEVASDYPPRFIAADRVAALLPTGVLIADVPELSAWPEVAPEGIVNSATGRFGPLSPGEIVSIYGTGLGLAEGRGPLFVSKLSLSTEVEDTAVKFNGVAAAILYTGANQINAVVPESVKGDVTVAIQVMRFGVPAKPVLLAAADFNPGVYTYPFGGRKYVAALRSDGTLQGADRPLKRGEVMVLYGTGFGLPEGLRANAVAVRPSAASAVPIVTIGGKIATVTYCGSAPGLT